MSGYERMERIIRWLDEHHAEQPSLGELAALVGLSEFHFHREFVRWTGITPKDFLQCLTLRHARERLAAGDAVLDAALAAGLSGPGRLHDLCVTLEAATPGEVKRGGAGLRIVWGMALSPFGPALLGETERGICRLDFCENDSSFGKLRAAWPRADFVRDDELAKERIEAIFRQGEAAAAPRNLRALVRGTPFQLRVWRALLEIPVGSLTTYRRLAERIGHPGAARAVGTAVGANSLACLIPCHRVIRETGALSGYRWGVGRKRSLIAWEGAAAPSLRT
ncbi:MAG: methylated-DNA--[protein]-cysteine S-methyltransferase [Verrucomicrobiaceae bacterium]|nr:methylated-DNA--[protein]-cysteine S-methyltransferase [Verrucomicrobiaceae bacterium]